jgi:hypothetical protein
MNDDLNQLTQIISDAVEYDRAHYRDFEKLMYGPLIFLSVIEALKICKMERFKNIHKMWDLWNKVYQDKANNEEI